jgi:cyclohexanecarboxylate-CoA ligase
MQQRPIPRASFYADGGWRDRIVADDLADHAKLRPGDVASVTYCSDGAWVESVTFGELNTAVDSIAAGLLDLEIKTGEAVCFQLPNWWQFNAMKMACERIGAVACPLHIILRQREVEFMLNVVHARLLIVPTVYRGYDFGALGRSLLPKVETLENVFEIDGPRGSEDSLHRQVLSRSSPPGLRDELAKRHPTGGDIASIQFTSGTTGVPKGVVHTHNSLYAAARLVVREMNLTNSDVVVMPSPLSHSTGLVYGCLMPTIAGMRVAYQDVWDAGRMLDIIEQEHGSWTAGATPFVLDTIRACRASARTAAPLRRGACSGASIPRFLAAQTKEATGASLATIWGLTETSGATVTSAGALQRAADSDGRVAPAMQIKIVDDDGQDVPAGRPGRLLVRGASLFQGYFERPDLTDDVVDAEGWLDSGDIASMDADDYIAIVGRAKDIVIRGGENVPVVEVENALLENQMVADVAVIGVYDERLGERACAIVVASTGATITLGGLWEYLAARGFAKHYWPERLELVASLPRTPSGKVQKFRLRQMFDAGPETPMVAAPDPSAQASA